MHRISFSLLLVAVTACADRNVEIAKRLVQIDPGGPPSVLMITQCQDYGSLEMDRACVVDSDGKSFGLAGNTEMIVTSAVPPYGAYFMFVDGATPLAEDIGTTGEDASVQVFAEPCRIENGSPCLPEGSQANRIAARASLTAEGGLLVTVHDAVPSGTQIAVTLQYGALYRSQLAPADGSACKLPFEICTDTSHRGWVARFYVGAPPAGTSP
jgi:hypothetical protein